MPQETWRLMQPEIQHMKPSIMPHKPWSTPILHMSRITGNPSRMLKEHVTMCSIKTSTTHSPHRMKSVDGNHDDLWPNGIDIRLPNAGRAPPKQYTLPKCIYFPNNAPEVLSHWIEQCQEIQTLGEDPYTPIQLLNNAIWLLLRCGLYQRNFEEWDHKIPTEKIWINL